MQKKEPTMFVKKADGSVVRVPLSQLKKQGGSQQTEPAPKPPVETPKKEPVAPLMPPKVEPAPKKAAAAKTIKPVSPPVPPPPPKKKQLPAVKPVESLATTTPVKDIFIDEAAAKAHEWEQDDHASLLEEPLDDAHANDAHPPLPPKRDRHRDAALKGLSFTIPEDLSTRAHSLVESRLKDIRTDDQFLLYATRESNAGGLGLTQKQAAELLASVVPHAKKPHTLGVPIKLPDGPPRPTVVPPIAPPTRKKPVGKKPMSADVLPKPKQVRPKMHDIQAPTPESKPQPKKTLGPVEELGTMSLTDFRRLGASADGAAQVVLQKFETLKDESYLLYLNALQAWYKSPTFLTYQSAAAAALQSGETVEANLASSQDGMRMDEFLAVAHLNSELDI